MTTTAKRTPEKSPKPRKKPPTHEPPAVIEVVTLEAKPTLRGGHDPSEMGKRGVAVREERRMQRLTASREHVELVQLPAAQEAYDDLLNDHDPRARRYRFAAAKDVYDRVMPVTQHVEVDIKAQISALVAAFKEA